MQKKVRVRFAPSPTGGLHLGGMRTVLYNYLFAKQQGGEFVLRIEDTDQSRYVAEAEEYIFECLRWARLEPDESPLHPAIYGPYRQSERKETYRKYAEQLVREGFAYYAFDTPEEIEGLRTKYSIAGTPAQYDISTRMYGNNQLRMGDEEALELIKNGVPYVIRIKMPQDALTITLDDLIRGEVKFASFMVDDKVLLKSDGMPTYHLAVVVDDYLMQITHAFRGEEWLPSAPVHILLWRYLFGEDQMPQWAHLPLIMGPNGKLSKRDGAKYGFPVFAMNWTDPKTQEMTEGFREKGFLTEAFINLLALLGWNDGTEQEIFGKDELIKKFSIERVHKAGAKFDYEKAKWFNHEWIKRLPVAELCSRLESFYVNKGIDISDRNKFEKVVGMVKDRCFLLTDFVEQSVFLFQAPDQFDLEAVKPKWSEEKKKFFELLRRQLQSTSNWEAAFIEDEFKKTAAENGLKPGELQLPLRIMFVGGKFGPPVFQIAEALGAKESIARIDRFLELI